LLDPRWSKDSSDDVLCLIGLVNGDAVRGDDEMETEEGGNLSERVNSPMFFEDFNNEVISLLRGAHA
jgi:hypothetical protein